MNADYDSNYDRGETLTGSSFKNCFNNILKHTELSQLEDIKKIKEWYENKDKGTKEKVLSVLDIIGNELTQIVTLPYIGSLIKKLEFKTENREISLKDTEIGLFDTDIHPYVEFRQLVSGQSIHSIKFKFHINIITNIKKLTAKLNNNHPIFLIEKLKIELRISLIGIETDILDKSIPINPLLKPIDLGKDKFEIDHLELFAKKFNTRNLEQAGLQQEINKQPDIIECNKCYAKIQNSSNFCNICRSKLDTRTTWRDDTINSISIDAHKKRSPI